MNENCYQGPDEGMPETFTSVNFTVDAQGRISAVKLTRRSNSVARNFWTMYAVASCPPVKPPTDLATPVTSTVDNFLVQGAESGETLSDRLAQQSAIARNSNSKYISFALIPASYREVFPGYFTIKEICAKENLVSLPISLFQRDSAMSSTQIASLLDEWPQFFRRNIKPSKADIINFASLLTKKYKAVLIEGKAEAPLP
jgi:hypothetical protein